MAVAILDRLLRHAHGLNIHSRSDRLRDLEDTLNRRNCLAPKTPPRTGPPARPRSSLARVGSCGPHGSIPAGQNGRRRQSFVRLGVTMISSIWVSRDNCRKRKSGRDHGPSEAATDPKTRMKKRHCCKSGHDLANAAYRYA